jgi:hypothetical protein
MAHLNQIAFYAPTDARANQIKRQFGLQSAKWIHDTVRCRSMLYPEKKYVEQIAELQFCDALGMQFEILRFTHGDHWCSKRANGNTFIAHIGIHLELNDEWPAIAGRLVQETWTVSHSNPLIPTNRMYHYRIYQMAPDVYVKYIKREER